MTSPSTKTARQLISALYPSLSFTHLQPLGDLLKVTVHNTHLHWESLAAIAEDCLCKHILAVTPSGQTIALHSVASIRRSQNHSPTA